MCCSVAKGALLDAVQEAQSRVKMLEQQLKAKVSTATGDASAQTDSQGLAGDSSLKAMKAEVGVCGVRVRVASADTLADRLRPSSGGWRACKGSLKHSIPFRSS